MKRSKQLLISLLVFVTIVSFSGCTQQEIKTTQKYIDEVSQYLTENGLDKYIEEKGCEDDIDDNKENEYMINLYFPKNNSFMDISFSEDKDKTHIYVTLRNYYETKDKLYSQIDYKMITDIVNIVSKRKFDCNEIKKEIKDEDNIYYDEDNFRSYHINYDFFENYQIIYSYNLSEGYSRNEDETEPEYTKSYDEELYISGMS